MRCSKGDELNAPPIKLECGFSGRMLHLVSTAHSPSRTHVAVSIAPTVAVGAESRVRVPFLLTKGVRAENHGLTDGSFFAVRRWTRAYKSLTSLGAACTA